MHLTAMGLEPDVAHPVEHDGREQPQGLGELIEAAGGLAIDIEGQHQHGGNARGGAQATDQVQVVHMPAPAGAGEFTPQPQAIEFGVALDQRQAEEDKQRKGQQPEGGPDAHRRPTGDDAKGVKAGQGHDVEDGPALEVQRVGAGQEEIPGQDHAEGRRQPPEADGRGAQEQQGRQE